MTCAICEEEIEPEPRYYTAAGEPRHMLCEDTAEEQTRPLTEEALEYASRLLSWSRALPYRKGKE